MTDYVPGFRGAVRLAATANEPVLQEADVPAVSTASPGNRHWLFRTLWIAVNTLLLVSLLMTGYSSVWEYSTRRYLAGFSDAIVPASQAPEVRIEAILEWMASGPARLPGDPSGLTPGRNPIETLNYKSLLRVCGSATNAFINLADSSGLAARRLLLLDGRRMTKHVVAEVLINHRWVVVDPAFRVVLRGVDGQTLTRSQLRDPAVFLAATGSIPGYDKSYTYESTSHIHLSRLRSAGLVLRAILDRIAPGWGGSPLLSLLVERESMIALIFSLLAVFVAIVFRIVLRVYAERRLGLRPVHFRRQVHQAWRVFLGRVA